MNKRLMLMGLVLISFAILLLVFCSSCGFNDGIGILPKTGDAGIPGEKGDTGNPGQNGLPCTVEQTIFGATITCPDGTSANIYNGSDGVGCSIEQTETGAAVTCGDNTVNITNGTNGQPGSDGLNGSSCSAVTMEDNAKYVVCTDGSNFQVFDGINGTNGQDSIIKIIDPCGKQSNTDEIFLKLSTGQTIAVYSDPSIGKIHLVELVEGSWVTTDGTRCYFSVDKNGEIYNEHN